MREITDKNMQYQENLGADDIEWHNYTEDIFRFYGISGNEDATGVISTRIPKKLAQEKGFPVYQCAMSAGGRIRFSTNSPYVAIRVKLGYFETPSIVTVQSAKGFDLYELTEDGKESYIGAFRPPQEDGREAYVGIVSIEGDRMKMLTLEFPLFSEVKELQLGFQKGSLLACGAPHINEEYPTVFYGSSITQGAAASRPGHTYEALISHNYNLNYMNLGFAGHAKGEPEMAEYISNLKMNIFVCDYDHNAPSLEYLQKTHFRFYEIIREKHPELPYIMVSRPDTMFYPEHSRRCREIIYESYQKARQSGDEKVYYIDGETLCSQYGREGFVDCTHPNDIGFMEISQVLGKMIGQILEREGNNKI